MLQIRTYKDCDKELVISLVLHCQNDGTRPYLTVDNQPDILNIHEEYIASGGNFWIATENGKVVGTIGLMNYGNGVGLLKKFFVYEPYRSAPHHLGSKLYNVLLEYAKENSINSLLLDTPKNTERAHKFYEKSGFKRIEKEQLPIIYDYPYRDSDFFYLKLNKL